MVLRRLYYREHVYCCEQEQFTEDVSLLLGDEAKQWEVYERG